MRASLFIVAAFAAPAVAKDPNRLLVRQEAGEAPSVSVASEASASEASTSPDTSPSTTTTHTTTSSEEETTTTSRTRTRATSTLLWTPEAETTAEASMTEADTTTEAWTAEAETTTEAWTPEALSATWEPTATTESTAWEPNTTTRNQAAALRTSSQDAPSNSATLLDTSTSALPPPTPTSSYDPSANLRQTATIPTDLTTEEKATTSYVDITATVEPTGYAGASQVYFPGTNTYWTYGAVSFVQWSPALPDPIDIQLMNDDPSLLPYTYTLSAGVGPGMTEMAVTALRPVEPGPGYYIVLADSGNGTLLSVSSEFEIKPKGTSPIYPAAYGAQISALVPSDAGRRVVTWAAAAGALIGAVTVLVG